MSSTIFSALAAAPNQSIWLPQSASTQAEAVDSVFYFILVLSTIFFGLIVAAMIYFVVRYRRRGDDDRTSPIEGHRGLEIAWSVIPAILLTVMFLWGFRSFMDMSLPPRDALEVRVLARKWSWEFDYPYQEISGASELVVPVGKPIKLVASSSDVIHSFFVPAFRIKRDVVPGRYTVQWFQAKSEGIYDIFCTEYCGTGHSSMLSKVKVVSKAKFDAWVESGGGMKKLSPLELGKKLFTTKGCFACHSTTAQRQNKPGPPLGGKYGKTETLAGGQTVKIDDTYLHESIVDPQAKIVRGFKPVMPTFKALKERQINGLIDYVKSLK